MFSLSLQDLRFAFRQIRRSPGFAAMAILTLALGVGANTAIFSLLDQALLRSLPVRDPKSLVFLQGTGKAWQGHTSNHGGGVEAYFSYPMYRDLRDKDKAFEGLLATSPASVDFTRGHQSRIADVELVSGNYFSLLGVGAAAGRLFTQAEDLQKGASAVAVLSYDFWRNDLQSDPSVVGSTVSLNGHPFEVIGVAAGGFRSAVWGETPRLFVPMSMLDQIVPGKGTRLTDHTDRWLNIMGRLQPGTTVAQAEVESAPLWHALREEELKAITSSSSKFRDEFVTRSRLLVVPAARGFSYSRGEFRDPLLAVMAMASLVLLIAVVNVASLLLVRSIGRTREFSVRYSLGASSRRIVQQLLFEGVLIGVAGGLIGILLAPAAVHTLVSRLAGEDGAAPFTANIDMRMLLFNFTVAIGFSLFFSLAPALQFFKPNLSMSLRQGSSTGGNALLLLRKVIVGVQIGLSLLLLVGAGLFLRTMQKLRQVDVGFRTDHLVTFAVAPRLAGYTRERVPALRQRLYENLAAVPGVESVGITNAPQLKDSTHGGNVTFASYKAAPDEDVNINKSNVNPSFFGSQSIPFVAGRSFTNSDDVNHPLVAIVNETLAKRYFGSAQRAVGQRLMDGESNHPTFDTEIVGVVRDFRQTGVRGEIHPMLFRPLDQIEGNDSDRALYVYLRARMDENALLGTVRQTVANLDPLLAVDSLHSMDVQIDEDLQNERLITLLALSFAALATALAGIGLYAVLAFATAQRTREIGVRIALGATRTGISRLVIDDVLITTSAAIVVSMPIALVLARLLRSQLFGVSPEDPGAITAAIVLIFAVAFIAAFIPAIRASATDPVKALRTE